MAPQKDLPGFYFDLEKNRYFPIKGPLPGTKRVRLSSSTSSSCGEHPDSGRKHHKQLGRRKKLESFELLQSREIHGGSLISKKGVHSFQQEYQKLQASSLEVCKYRNTMSISDYALEGMRGVVQTTEGLKEMYLLATGGINCTLSLYRIKNVHFLGDYGATYRPEPMWPSSRTVLDRVPEIFSTSAAFTSLSSSVTCIRRIDRNIPNATDSVSNFQHALVSTLGSGASGGSVYVLNLSEPLIFSENSQGLHRRMNKVASCDCTIWTADANSNSSNAAIGTNYGVSLINLETGRSSLVYRSRSDVLSQQFDLSGNVLLCGIRKGAIVAIDVRQGQSKCFEAPARPAAKPKRNLKSPPAVSMSSAVCSVFAFQSDEQYFLGSSMDGSIKLFDRRFLNRDVQSYEGHVNSHSFLKLGVNPSETLVLSGGEDCSIRIWSVKTGELILEKKVPNCIFSTVYWPHYGDFSYGYDQFLKNGDNPYMSTSSWGVWLGSRGGLHYMFGP